MGKLKVAVLFGGKSPEHEVSIITGIQILNALDLVKYDPRPIYVTKEGEWLLGDESFYKVETFSDTEKVEKKGKKILLQHIPGTASVIERPENFTLFKSFLSESVDVAIPAFHGKYGEDGSVQGLLELAQIPYVGCGVAASSIGMDKIISRSIARGLGLPVLPDNWGTKEEWLNDKKEFNKKITSKLKYPVFVKPSTLGSSIGINKVLREKNLEEALEVAFFFDSRVIVEEGLENAKDINISILGNNPYKFSVCEQPVSSKSLLSFEDKYLSGAGKSKGMASAKRIVPANIKKQTEKKIQEIAATFFANIGGAGIARVDFLVSSNESKVYFNEVNTLPGSFAFYLWQKSGISFPKLLDDLIGLAFSKREKEEKLNTTFKSNILSNYRESSASKLSNSG